MIRYSTIFLLALSLAAAGCGESNGKNAPQGAQKANNTVKRKGTIGFSALTLTNPFFKVIADNMKVEAEKHGYDLIVVSAERDVKTQADQLNEFIVKGVAAIVLNPCDSQSIGPAIVKANKAGIPVFTNDLKYEGSEGQVVCHVATENYQGGKLAGEAMVRLLSGTGGKVAIIHFPQAESCQLRVKGFLEILEVHNAKSQGDKIEIVATLDGGGARDEGFKAAKDAIEANPDLAAIFAINDPSGLGARSALESVTKQDQVKIIAFDGQLIGKQAIRDGKIVCDPIQFPDRIGRSTVEQILKYFNGDEVPKEILIPSELYYKTDADKDPELNDIRIDNQS
ncbi:MAG: substrate-binding domain-containing protein [Schlesneria sp.]